jgi:hypothetical protein
MKTKLLIVLSFVFFFNLKSQNYLKLTTGNTSSYLVSDGWATIDFGTFQNHVLYKTTNLTTNQTYYGDSLSNLGYGAYYVLALSSANISDTIGACLFDIDDQSNNLMFNCNFRLDSLVMNTPVGCDGVFYLSVAGDSLAAYPGYVVKTGNNRYAAMNGNNAIADSICAGPVAVMLTDTATSNTVSFTTLYMGPWTLSTPAFYPQVITAPVSAFGVCDGAGQVSVSGGTAPFQYSWDSGISYTSADSATGLCAGIHDVIVIDANGDTVSVYYVISDSSNVITNPNPYGPFGATIVFNTTNCSFDYNLPVDSAYITLYNVIDTNTIFISWDIWQNGTLTQVSDTVSYTYSGVNQVQLDMFCGNGRMMTSGFNSIDVIDYINTGAAVGINAIKKGDESTVVYPNPFSEELKVDYVASGPIVHVVLRDLLGKTVYVKDYPAVKGINTFSIDGSGLDKGTYFLELNSADKTTIEKVIK